MSTMIEERMWSDILHAVEKRLNRQSFETWFRPIRFGGCDNSEQVLHLRAPNQVVKDWVSSNYSEVLDESLEELKSNPHDEVSEEMLNSALRDKMELLREFSEQ